MFNKRLLRLLKENKGVTLLALVFKILFAVSVTLMSYSLTVLFDAYTLHPDKFLLSLAFVGGVMVVTVVLSWLSDALKARYIRAMNLSLKSMITDKVVQDSYEVIVTTDTGKTMSWFINDAQQIEGQVFEQVINLVYMVSLVISAFVSILLLHWTIALAAIVSLLLSMTVPKLVQGHLVAAQEKLTQANEQYTEALRDNVAGLGVFVFGHALQTFRQRLLKASVLKEEKQFESSLTQTKVGAVILLVSLLAQFGLIAFALYMSSLGLTTAGSVLSVASLSGNLFNGLQGILSVLASFNASDVLLDKFQTTVDTTSLQPLEGKVETMTLKEVTFKHASTPLIEKFSYTFSKGRKYALVGASGSGKSTLLRILLGLNRPESGQVLVNGRPLETMDLASYYHRLAYIEQSLYLFNGTIRDNITLGATIADEKLTQVIAMTQLEEFVASQPQGLDTLIMANAQGVSGGEQQRISLARAILQEVDFIIIDETTSQLDDANRRLIEETILGLTGIGLIYISHHTDPMMLELFDEVLDSQAFR